MPGRLDSAQQDGLGEAETDRRAGECADHMSERVAQREQELAALQHDQRFDRERREGREPAQQAGDQEQPPQLVRRVLEPEQDGADQEAADAIDEQRAERKAGPARVQPQARAPAQQRADDRPRGDGGDAEPGNAQRFAGASPVRSAGALPAAMPQRAKAASSPTRASTQRAPSGPISFFQNGACVFR